MALQVTLLCGLNLFTLAWASVSAVLCSQLILIWLNCPRDTHPSTRAWVSGKLFAWKKNKYFHKILKETCNEHLSHTGKEILVAAAWLGQNHFSWQTFTSRGIIWRRIFSVCCSSGFSLLEAEDLVIYSSLVETEEISSICWTWPGAAVLLRGK